MTFTATTPGLIALCCACSLFAFIAGFVSCAWLSRKVASVPDYVGEHAP